MSRVFSRQLWNERKGRFEAGSLLLRSGRIDRFDWGEPAKTKTRSSFVDLDGLKIAPSSVDMHVHSRGFDESHKENFETLEASALQGGVSVMACMANTRPRLDTVARIKEFFRLTQKSSVRMVPFAAVTEGLEGRLDTDWNALLKLPVAGLSDDGKPLLDEDRFVRALKTTKRFKKVLSLHEEDLHCSEASVLHLSQQSMRTGHAGSPAEAEFTMVERDLKWSAKLKAPIHLCHLSSKESVALIRKYRRLGAMVSAELTPHHGLLTVDDFPEESRCEWSQFKVCPVIREKSDQKVLLAALRTGEIDCFASDHAPHSRLEKDLPMDLAAHGIQSLENHFVLYDQIRRSARLSWKRFFELSSLRPASLLGLAKDYGGLREGLRANFIVFDEIASRPLSWAVSKSRNGPWGEQPGEVRVFQHWIDGRCHYENKS